MLHSWLWYTFVILRCLTPGPFFLSQNFFTLLENVIGHYQYHTLIYSIVTTFELWIFHVVYFFFRNQSVLRCFCGWLDKFVTLKQWCQTNLAKPIMLSSPCYLCYWLQSIEYRTRIVTQLVLFEIVLLWCALKVYIPIIITSDNHTCLFSIL